MSVITFKNKFCRKYISGFPLVQWNYGSDTLSSLFFKINLVWDKDILTTFFPLSAGWRKPWHLRFRWRYSFHPTVSTWRLRLSNQSTDAGMRPFYWKLLSNEEPLSLTRVMVKLTSDQHLDRCRRRGRAPWYAADLDRLAQGNQHRLDRGWGWRRRRLWRQRRPEPGRPVDLRWLLLSATSAGSPGS